jgi:predicted dienelactone hydrolase
MTLFLRGRLARAVAVGVAGLMPLLANPAPAPATDTLHPTPATDTLHLPEPTGSNRVGTTAVYLKDTSRLDPWVSGKNRELMVTLWYPTRSAGGARAPYMTAKESELALEHAEEAAGVRPDILSTVRTNAYVDARPAGRPHSLPLVVLSPGYTQPRSTLSGLAEDLASHGYVVAAIDHTYETYAVTFPDGRIAPCVACEADDVDDRSEFYRKLHQGRAADVSFVLDQLTARTAKWPGSALIDSSRIGMSGHSAGGASAIVAMLNDPRIDAGIDMDGTTYVPASGLSRPVMFLGAPHHAPGGEDTSWDRDWKLLSGWKRWLVVAGTQHPSFTDVAVLSDQLGIDFGATATGTRSMEITRRYNRAMFDLHLRHRPQPLLRGPSLHYPEVAVTTA